MRGFSWASRRTVPDFPNYAPVLREDIVSRAAPLNDATDSPSAPLPPSSTGLSVHRYPERFSGSGAFYATAATEQADALTRPITFWLGQDRNELWARA